MLQAEINSLAKKYGGRSVPAHLTLMGGIVDDVASAKERARLLSSQLKVGSCCNSCIVELSTFDIVLHS